MLVLSRRVGEHVVLAGGIEVHVRRIAGNQVDLGFVAPRDIRIERAERWTGEDPPTPADAAVDCDWDPVGDFRL